MPSSERIVRQDLVEVHRDRNGRMPGFVLLRQPGALILAEDGDRRSVILLRDGRPPLQADLETVRSYGTPRGPFGSTSLGERALRLGIGKERIIVAFTGAVTDLSGSFAELQLGRLTGEMDLFDAAAAVREFWQNRGFWGRSREAANAWRDLLGNGKPSKSRTARQHARPPAERGGAGVGARYSEGFREQAVATAHTSGKSVAAVARELEISPTTLRRWMSDSPAVSEKSEG